MAEAIRVRFAPAPTGTMHLGNIRTALFNYLFAHQKKGTFILRIEDTDPERNFDIQGKQIIADLHWLSLFFDEGPGKEGPFSPYFQSERTHLYQQKLEELIQKGIVYPCFCTKEELDKKRQRQIALKQPPRYDRTCLSLSPEEIKVKFEAKIPYIWRLKLDHEKTVTISDMAHGTMTGELKNFSDFPLTRQDGTFTFMFANAIDDIMMNITHVLRGEDHVTNSFGQVVLYESFNAPVPEFWHMPILCNTEGKKLSKRDFGFSLLDLQKEGFLPEAIINYLGILGSSYEEEIISLETLVKNYDFSHLSTASQIKYDAAKLKWINHKWLSSYPIEKLVALALPFIKKEFPEIEQIPFDKQKELLELARPELIMLSDAPALISFYFRKPQVTQDELIKNFTLPLHQSMCSIINKHFDLLSDPHQFIENIKKTAEQEKIKVGKLLQWLRFVLIGKTTGPGIFELLTILEPKATKERLSIIK